MIHVSASSVPSACAARKAAPNLEYHWSDPAGHVSRTEVLLQRSPKLAHELGARSSIKSISSRLEDILSLSDAVERQLPMGTSTPETRQFTVMLNNCDNNRIMMLDALAHRLTRFQDGRSAQYIQTLYGSLLLILHNYPCELN